MISDNLQASVLPVLAWLMTYTVHSTLLLGGAALVAWRVADEHGWLARLWKAAMLGAILTTSVQLTVAREPLGRRWAVIPDQVTLTSVRGSESPVPARQPNHKDLTPDRDRTTTSPEIARSAKTITTLRSMRDDPVAASPAADARGAWRALRGAWPVAAVAAWCVLAAFGLARLALVHRRVRRVLFAGACGGGDTVDQLATEMRGLWGRGCSPASRGQEATVRLVVSTTCDVPVALPGRAIVIPERFTTELGADEQRAALAHEIAHVVRRDPEWLSLAVVLERVFFFQPLNRLARRELSASAEFLCDEWAVRNTGTPLALARCLASVAAWASPATGAQIGVVAMARRDSPLVRRVERILSEPRVSRRHPSSMWLAAGVFAVGSAAPMFSAAVVPSPSEAVTGLPPAGADVPQAATEQPQGAADAARAREELRIFRPPNPADSLRQRWDWAVAEANRRGLHDFWIAYSFDTPTHAEHLMMSDSVDGSFVNDKGHAVWQGPPLSDVLGDTSPTGVGTVVITLKYSSGRDTAISRGGYRSARLGFDFGRRPVFWIGYATETDSFRQLEQLTSQVDDEKLRILFIEAASLHPTTDLVLPFLVRLLDPSNPVAIRREAAEGFDHHHDARSVEILVRTARQDPSEDVRAEAAETIGEVQTPESIPALKELALRSPDSGVRREAAEAFADQPADRAIPALEAVIAASTDDDTLGEAVEALGDIGGERAAAILLDVAWKHANEHARREAVETLANIDGDASLAALVRVVWEHPDVATQREAVESLGDKAGSAAIRELERIVRDHPVEDVQAEAIETIMDVSEGLNQLIVQTARSGKNARVRREAIDALSHAAGHTSDARLLDQIEQVLEAAIFEDPDHSVSADTIDALKELPKERAKRVLRKVIDRHPDAQMREEAMELDREQSR